MPSEASHCGRVALMRQGRLIADGAPAELLRKTRTTSLEDAFLALARRQDAPAAGGAAR